MVLAGMAGGFRVRLHPRGSRFGARAATEGAEAALLAVPWHWGGKRDSRFRPSRTQVTALQRRKKCVPRISITTTRSGRRRPV